MIKALLAIYSTLLTLIFWSISTAQRKRAKRQNISIMKVGIK